MSIYLCPHCLKGSVFPFDVQAAGELRVTELQCVNCSRSWELAPKPKAKKRREPSYKGKKI